MKQSILLLFVLSLLLGCSPGQNTLINLNLIIDCSAPANDYLSGSLQYPIVAASPGLIDI